MNKILTDSFPKPKTNNIIQTQTSQQQPNDDAIVMRERESINE